MIQVDNENFILKKNIHICLSISYSFNIKKNNKKKKLEMTQTLFRGTIIYLLFSMNK